VRDDSCPPQSLRAHARALLHRRLRRGVVLQVVPAESGVQDGLVGSGLEDSDAACLGPYLAAVMQHAAGTAADSPGPVVSTRAAHVCESTAMPSRGALRAALRSRQHSGSALPDLLAAVNAATWSEYHVQPAENARAVNLCEDDAQAVSNHVSNAVRAVFGAPHDPPRSLSPPAAPALPATSPSPAQRAVLDAFLRA
jgi:hypothetical protein